MDLNKYPPVCSEWAAWANGTAKLDFHNAIPIAADYIIAHPRRKFL